MFCSDGSGLIRRSSITRIPKLNISKRKYSAERKARQKPTVRKIWYNREFWHNPKLGSRAQVLRLKREGEIMKRIETLKKSVVIAAVCLVVLCVSGYSEPTPEQIAERTEILLQAVEKNDVERAKLCIKLGANVNAKVYYDYINYQGRNAKDCYTILTYAVGNNCKDITKLLIESGADINLKDDEGNTALMYAAFNGYRDIAESLINAGADMNAKILLNNRRVKFLGEQDPLYGNTALLLALKNEKDDVAKLLIRSGADVNLKDNSGGNALMNAVPYGHKDMVELLVKSGADVNAKSSSGWTALMNAVGNGYRDIAELLVKSGADVNAKNNNNMTALMYAAMCDYKDIAEIFIKAGADGDAALKWAVENNKYDAVKLLIELGVDVNVKDSDGLTLLTHAILYGKKDIAQLLRAAGAKE